MLSAAMPSRLLTAFPPGAQVSRVPLEEAIRRVGAPFVAQRVEEPV
jgi:ATP-dependent DNA helicase DinG